VAILGSGQAAELVESVCDAVGEQREVRHGVRVADDVEVQLARVGEGSDANGDVSLHDTDLKDLGHLGT
jgi:hypothetical protein